MKFHIATLTSFPWNEICAAEFRQLADLDRFREHSLTAEPEEADGILIVDLHQHTDDWQLHLLDHHPLALRFPHKIFVYDERARPCCKWPGVFVSMRRNGFDYKRQRAYSYFRFKNAFPFAAVGEPDLLYSFQGACSHPVRSKVLNLSHRRAVLEDPRFNFFDYSDRASTQGYQDEVCRLKEQYRQMITRSKFVLCPRGSATSSFRLYETLSAGRVPVIISDAWMAPQGPEWSSCSIRVPEAQVSKISAMLESREDEYPQLSQAAFYTYHNWFAPEVMFHRIVEQCADLLQHGRMGRNPLYVLGRQHMRCALGSYKSRFLHRLKSLRASGRVALN